MSLTPTLKDDKIFYNINEQNEDVNRNNKFSLMQLTVTGWESQILYSNVAKFLRNMSHYSLPY